MFVHLKCHSQYSFLRAVGSPEELIARAAAEKMPAVALTDTNGMYAAIPFYAKAREAGVKPIVGTVLDVGESVPVVLLAEDAEGYSNLCRLVTRRQLGEKPVTMEELEEHSKGVMALAAMKDLTLRSFPTRSEFSIGPDEDRRDEGCEAAEKERAQARVPVLPMAGLKEIFGERLYLEVRLLSAGDRRTLREAERLGRELGVKLAATNNVHFLRPEEHLHHRAVNAVRTGRLLTTVGPPDITSGGAWFKPAAEMERLFADSPEAVRATIEIAERCNLELELGKLIFPEFPVPEGETPFSYLSKLSFEGARERYRPLRPEVLTRLAHELGVIEKLSLAPYFLLVWDIVEEAKRRGIPAVARGSAASSMVTYCLGISRVCPLRWGLYFERFLNEQRGDCPDIDIDICGARRDDLLDYVYKRWGKEHVAGDRQGPHVGGAREGPRVAMIGSFVTMHARLAVREVAKVFGVPPEEVNRFTKRLPHRPVREILEAIRALPECRSLPVEDEPWKTILEVALRLDDAPRHLGIHPCGTVISARPLTDLVPLETATKGIVVTQYDMNAIEALGLIKMDLLGQRGFTTMSLALDNVEKAQEGKEGKEVKEAQIAADGETPCPKPRVIDYDAIPEHDAATCAMLAEGRTMGIFQIESPGMRGLLRALKARTLEELAMTLALIRPGASEYGSKELFLKRLRGEVKVEYAHPALEKILGDSFGVCIYQEQVMRIAQAVGKMSLAEADLVRRSSVKFAGERERERLRGKFLKAAERMGLAGKAREETWQMVEKFAGFGFCKAHAATYADISYRMAYLKAHWPAEFLAAMCSAGAGFYHVSAYVEEAKRWGIEVRLPSVNDSRIEYTTESVQASNSSGQAMRIGLMQVKGLRIATMASIVREREEHGLYRSLEDFLGRVAVERDEIEALIKCGAFDGVAPMTRPAMLWRWNLLQAGDRREIPRLRADPAMRDGTPLGMTDSLFAATGAEDEAAVAIREMPAAEYTREQRLEYEREILEVCVSGHPLDSVARNGEAWSNELEGRRGRRVTLLGWVITFRHVGTKNYRNMMFVTLEDQRGVYEAVLFPEAYERYGGLVFETRTMRVTGRVEQDGQINCEKLEAVRK